MSVRNLLYKREYPVTDSIKIMIPTVGDILDNEDSYYSMISLLTATPYDMMVQLDDMGIDFTEISDYELFLMLFNMLKTQDTSLVFGDLNISDFKVMVNPENNMIVLKDANTGAVIDKGVYYQICSAICRIHHIERVNKTPANGPAKEFMIQRARAKMKRKKHSNELSHIEEMIVALVNTEQFHYDFDGVRKLTIYQFNESARQVIKKIDFDNKMHGIYAGTISAKDMSQDDLNWLTHK